MSYLNELNSEQRDAVINIKGPSLVIAGAGSGKTRVLTYRIAHLLNEGVKANRILALTFTNKAAREMKNRVSDIVGSQTTNSLWMGTFHSIFSRILRYEADTIGYTSNFTIYDSQDSKNLIKSIIKDLKLDDKTYKPNEVYGRISMAKNNLVTAEAYQHNSQIQIADNKAKKPDIYEIYKYYSARCKKADAMDFDDLLLQTNILFRDHPQILEKYQKHFDYILVDEYQDTNYSQYLIVKKLAAIHNNVCVVGDDAQSIYSFRGAKIENILNFRNDYKNFKLYKLERNYRSTPTIVRAANSVISNNIKQITKAAYSKKEEGDKIELIKTLTDKEEGFKIAKEIHKVQGKNNCEYSDFAILYRTNSQSRSFEDALLKMNIPYKIYGGLSFYQRKEIKDLIAYFRLLINNNDEEALKRIVNYPKRGIGSTTLEKVKLFATHNDMSMWEIMSNLNIFPLDFNASTVKKLLNFCNLIRTFSLRLEGSTAYDIAYDLCKTTGIIQELSGDKSPEGVSRYENIQELLNSIKDYSQTALEEGNDVSLVPFVREIALLTDQDSENKEDRNKITLMTVHSAKGLEFKYVFIVGVEEDLFPSQMSSGSPHGLEEERRLFYVALTRAEDKVYISYTLSRYKWGNLIQCKQSRFIREIDSQCIKIPTDLNRNSLNTDGFNYRNRVSSKPKFNINGEKRMRSVNSIKKTGINSNENFTPDNPNKIEEGMTVVHERFGIGEILKIENDGMNRKATVHFRYAGEKQLLLKFAKLKIEPIP